VESQIREKVYVCERGDRVCVLLLISSSFSIRLLLKSGVLLLGSLCVCVILKCLFGMLI